MPDSRTVSVHLLPALIPAGSLDGSTAIVVDVLRATTVMVHALNSGCREIVPCLEIEDALRVANARGRGTTVLGGEREGLPIEGFELGNSPESYSPQVCGGKTVVMTTTNGTRAILACREASRVLVASFANLGATVRFIKDREARHVGIVCAGTNGEISHEDTLLAGAITAELTRDGSEGESLAPSNDSARIALAHWWQAERAMEAGRTLRATPDTGKASGTRNEGKAGGTRDEHAMEEGRALESILGEGKGGRRVREIGLALDIAAAARWNTIKVVAELRHDPLRIVSAKA